MVNKKIYRSSLSVSVALTLGLSGCSLFESEDSSSMVPVEPLPSNIEGTASVDFNVFVSGKAVKGTLRGAELVVKELKNGELVDVAFRSELVTVEKTATGTSEAVAAELAKSQIVSESPQSLLTADDGTYGFYIDQQFSGALYITIKTTKTSGFIKCDALLGCGDFSASSENDVNSNSKIDFDEWYQDDLTLNVVKEITAQASRQAKGAEGTTKAYTANATIFTTLASELLQKVSQDGGVVSSETVADASLNTLLLLLGPEAAKDAVLLSGDISLGGAVDFTDVTSEDTIDAGTLALINVASTLQNIASNSGGSSSLDTVLDTLKQGVTDGSFKGSEDAAVAQLAATLQEEVNKTATVFVAIASGDVEAIKAALKEVAPELDDDSLNELAEKAKDARDKAIESGATDENALEDAAEDSKNAVEDLGCEGDECNADDSSLINDSLTELLASLTQSQTQLSSLNVTYNGLISGLQAVVALGETAQTQEEKENYLKVADDFIAELVSSNLEQDTVVLVSRAGQILASAEGLLALTTDAQSAATDSQTLVNNTASLSSNVTSMVTGANAEREKAVALLDDASSAAKVLAEAAIERAKESEQTFNTANADVQSQFSDATNLFASAGTDLTALEAALASSQSAVDKFSALNALTAEILSDVDLAKTRAEEYLALATTDAQRTEAQQFVTESTTIQQAVTASVTTFKATESDIRTLNSSVSSATDNARGKSGTDKMTSIAFVTKEGADAVFNAGEVVYDVVRDIWDQNLDSGSHSGTAPNYPEWTYRYNTDTYEVELTNTQGDEHILANAQVNSGATSKIILTWTGTLKSTDGQTVLVKSPDLAECERWSLDVVAQPNASCSVIFIDGSITTIEDARNFDASSAKTFNIVEFVDGQYGFNGTLASELTSTDSAGNAVPLFVSGATEHASIVMSGVTEGLSFTADFALKNEDDNDELGLAKIMLNEFNGYVFNVNLVDTDGPLTGDVTLYNDTTPVKVGDVIEITNGFRVTYVDGQVIDYTDIDFLGQNIN
ncbi:hypothetical protein [Pseudoalteromonas luteoviolacea]|uniref:Uncharacterized protein n=1 Tax=Pseudoalteromonas luteoviolacea S4054 TaxID=1129367 RepID=A0A0F6AGD2_9GAMM|nr:hypothetical protein [Pseudoalteromonas luteoviolacea]AOT08016.1 hypothetical protein S4054249_09230 [Pseudoalteromonas luteoviolacea]AOT12933.1 hypothetical protein S40542_09230 [Pseudoalteromonas luteoviolacea]AOT17845.1 hypothetical protein S4054_09225 [Pseudoalteromonas luteoviolacea]KKE84434.1 hypothetical protein N479_09340 [Pseudoalteromonas luteoviolacea S4054]KZN71809.1 hypothetical protein N481_17880 [Pseudoalteromonas luteoviolacea S4047-1]